MESRLKRNIALLYVVRAGRSALFAIGIIVPFYQQLGLSHTSIYVLQAIFSGVIVGLEVPSGYFADRFGRKRSIVIGSLFVLAGWIGYLIADSFAGLALVEVLLAIGVSFTSGADDALRYDSLLALDRAADNKRTLGRMQAVSGLAEGSASLIGGFLAVASLRTPFAAQVVLELGLLAAALGLYEVEVKRTRSARNVWKDVTSTVRYALADHREIKWLIVYAAMIGTLTYTVVWLIQPYYALVGIPLALFGVLWAAQELVRAAAALLAERFSQRTGTRRALYILPLLGVGAYLGLGAAPSLILLPLILVFYVIRGLQVPIVQNEVDQLVPSELRATINSVSSLVSRLSFAVFGVVVGLVTDAHGLQVALLFSAVLYAILYLVVISGMRKNAML